MNKLTKSDIRTRIAILAPVIVLLLGGMWAGLFRMSVRIPSLHPYLPLNHGPIMVSGFLGSLIVLERAVALRKPWAFGASAVGALGGLFALIKLFDPLGPILITLSSVGLVVIFIIFLRQRPKMGETLDQTALHR